MKEEKNLFEKKPTEDFKNTMKYTKNLENEGTTLLMMILSSGSLISTCIPISGLEGANPFVRGSYSCVL
jgi:hypothetical protein